MEDRRGFLTSLLALPFAAKAAVAGGGAPQGKLIKGVPMSFEFDMVPRWADGVRGLVTNVPTFPDFNSYMDFDVYEEVVEGFTQNALPAPAEGEPCPFTSTSVMIASPSTRLCSRFETTP